MAYPPKKKMNALQKAAEYKPSKSFQQAVKQSTFKKLPSSLNGMKSQVGGGAGNRPDVPTPATNFFGGPTKTSTSVKSGGVKVGVSKSKKDGSVTKTKSVKANGTEVTRTRKRKTAAKTVSDAMNTASDLTSQALDNNTANQSKRQKRNVAKKDTVTTRRSLNQEKNAKKLEKIKAKTQNQKLKQLQKLQKVKAKTQIEKAKIEQQKVKAGY